MLSYFWGILVMLLGILRVIAFIEFPDFFSLYGSSYSPNSMVLCLGDLFGGVEIYLVSCVRMKHK